MLALIEARLEGRVASGADMDSYTIAGRSVGKIPFAELMHWRGVYAYRVSRERNRGKGGLQFSHGAFTNAS